MPAKGNFLLQTRFVLNALIGGSDAEKISRHWPDYKITFEDGKRFCFELVGGVEDEAPAPGINAAGEAQMQIVDLSVPAPPTSELDLARLAANQAADAVPATPAPLVPVE